MKINYTLASVIASFLLMTSAMAEHQTSALRDKLRDKLYVRANVIVPLHSKFGMYKAKKKIGFQIAAGWTLHRMISSELEINYFNFSARRTDPGMGMGDERKLKSWSGFINIIAHPIKMAHDAIKPFIGIGIGYVRHAVTQIQNNANTNNTVPLSKNSSSLAYQAFIGLEYTIKPNLSLLADVRWTDLGKAKVGITNNYAESNKLRMQTFTIGVKYKF